MSVESAADERIWSVPRADARSDARAGESAKLVRWRSALEAVTAGKNAALEAVAVREW